jgi:hypothetical protein
MGTVIDRLDVTRGSWRSRHSALHLAVAAARACLHQAGRDPDDLDLLVNAGIYRDRNLGEPALAALIQDDIGANPEDPHDDAHGTFSFDVANGICGVLTALQIVDGFLRSHTIDRALVVASDADPGRGMSEHFPFSPAGAAMLCDWTDDDYGLRRVHWANFRTMVRISVPPSVSKMRATYFGSASRPRWTSNSPPPAPRWPAAAFASLRWNCPMSTPLSQLLPATGTAPHSAPASGYPSIGSPSQTTRECTPPR